MRICTLFNDMYFSFFCWHGQESYIEIFPRIHICNLCLIIYFVHSMQVVRWGRSVYANIQKFIQFQLTVNVAALTINVVAAVSSGEVPLTAVQVLLLSLSLSSEDGEFKIICYDLVLQQTLCHICWNFLKFDTCGQD